MENNNQVVETKNKKSKKKWIILAVALILFIAIASSGSSEPTVETVTDNVSSQSDETNKNEVTTTKATNEITVGSSVSNNTVKITFKSCNTDFKGYSQYAEIKSGYKIVQAVFDFENISSSDISLNGFECYADGAKCESFYYVDDYSDPVLSSISAGRKLNDATIYYEVPANSQSIELEYEADYWSDEKFIFIIK